MKLITDNILYATMQNQKILEKPLKNIICSHGMKMEKNG